jgi:poly(A) polymerase
MIQHLSSQHIIAALPAWLRVHLRQLHGQLGGELYLAGGVVRDLLLGKVPQDIDLTVSAHAQDWAARLAELTGGALVPLGRQEDAARVVAHGVTVDFAAFRQGAPTIAADLGLRDLTINALAIDVGPLLAETDLVPAQDLLLIDPSGGVEDLVHGRIRLAGATSLLDDPLRMVRVFRFAAILGFTVEAATLAQIKEHHHLITRPAVERINHELDLLMASGHAAPAVRAMADCGLLGELLPELLAGQGMEQPASHHLDVFGHSLEALAAMERLLAAPEAWFPESGELLRNAVHLPSIRRRLCWAALLHDVGKPATFARRADKDDRITFYHHDHIGVRLLEGIAQHYRWSNEDCQQISLLITLHMRPFFLANAERAGQLTLRACIRLLRTVGDSLPGLMLLAMADSLAGKGEASVAGMEEELAALLARLLQVQREHVAPVKAAAPLITGNDLIHRLGLAPGPIFKTILGAVEEAQMEGRVRETDEALALAQHLAIQMTPPSSTP